MMTKATNGIRGGPEENLHDTMSRLIRDGIYPYKKRCPKCYMKRMTLVIMNKEIMYSCQTCKTIEFIDY